MAKEIRLWKIQQDDSLVAVNQSTLNLEERLENWLEQDITLISDNLMVIGRQIETGFGGKIDLLCLDDKGDIVIVELKRDKSPREITAQVLDYASWVKDLSNDRITNIAERYLEGGEGSLEEAFQGKFGMELPDVLNESHSMLIIASQIDPATERIIKYLSDSYGVDINAITFQYFKDPAGGQEHIARTFLIQPSQVEYKSQQARGTSKRRANLSLEDLQEIADQNGVGEMYKKFIDTLALYFNKSTTQSSVAFYGNFNGNRRTIFSLIPPESNQEEGLKFQLYLLRFNRYFNTSDEKVLAILPEHHKHWKYYPGADEDLSGYAGYFRDEREVTRFLEGLNSFRDTSLHLESRG